MKKYFLILLVWTFASCGGDNTQVPEELLSKEEMVKILIDVHITEAKVTQSGLPADSGKIAFQKAKDEILKKNHIQPELFEQSYNYYMSNLKGMDEIYAAVVDSLSFREARGKLD